MNFAVGPLNGNVFEIYVRRKSTIFWNVDTFDNSGGSSVDRIMTVELNMNIDENNKMLNLYFVYLIRALFHSFRFNSIAMYSMYFPLIHNRFIGLFYCHSEPSVPIRGKIIEKKLLFFFLNLPKMEIECVSVCGCCVCVCVCVHIFWRQCTNTH